MVYGHRGEVSYGGGFRYPTFIFNNRSNLPEHVVIGDGSHVPVTAYGNSFLPNTSVSLSNTLIAPTIVKNLISAHQFTRDNSYYIEFDPFGFSVKDLRTKAEILRCNSSGDLYPFTPSPSAVSRHQSTRALSLSAHAGFPSHLLWNCQLGHPGDSALSVLGSKNFIYFSKTLSRSLCTACQLGKHSRLFFSVSKSVTSFAFELIHADLWTSPVPSFTGFKFFLVLLDDLPIILGRFLYVANPMFRI